MLPSPGNVYNQLCNTVLFARCSTLNQGSHQDDTFFRDAACFGLIFLVAYHMHVMDVISESNNIASSDDTFFYFTDNVKLREVG